MVMWSFLAFPECKAWLFKFLKLVFLAILAGDLCEMMQILGFLGREGETGKIKEKKGKDPASEIFVDHGHYRRM